MSAERELPLWMRVKARQEALDELRRVVDGAQGGGEHIILLSSYEVANLKHLFHAMGYAAVVDRSPLMAANTGDWVGQIASRLPHVDHLPNADWQELARRAKEWR